jgi:hypothetical protein
MEDTPAALYNRPLSIRVLKQTKVSPAGRPKSHSGRTFLLEPQARENRQPGIFLEAGISQCELAEKKHRTAVGFDTARMSAVLAEPNSRLRRRIFLRCVHGLRITVRLESPLPLAGAIVLVL